MPATCWDCILYLVSWEALVRTGFESRWVWISVAVPMAYLAMLSLWLACRGLSKQTQPTTRLACSNGHECSIGWVMIAYSSNCLISQEWLASIAEGDSIINVTLLIEHFLQARFLNHIAGALVKTYLNNAKFSRTKVTHEHYPNILVL